MGEGRPHRLRAADVSDIHHSDSQEQAIAELERLLALAETGELHCVAARLFNADGTWEDVAFGGTEAERETMLAKLRARH
jgi:hypothetical protein